MYKVVIVDDEPIIVEGLCRTVQWDTYQCQVVGTANDGAEGAGIIREKRPDIIFSDIAMPGVDGLNMIAGLKSEFPNMMISILTGYRDFEYARKAISLGVTRFLLKPSNMDEINEAVLAMTEKLKQRNILPKEDGSGEVPSEEESTASSFIVKNAMNYIENNYRQKLTLSDVAEKTYVSQWHLSKLLNRHLGQNFSEILNGVRIKQAKELLKDASLRIGDIAEEVGFVDIAHFSRVFKKITGISANEYRNQLGKEDIH